MMRWRDMTKDERLKIVREGFALNLSFSQIAEPYGCTRNAVIGFAHRNGLSSHFQRAPAIRAPKPPKAARKKNPVPPAPWSAKATPAPIISPSPLVVLPAEPPASLRLPILARSHLQCPWVDGRGDDGLATVCGHPLEPGANWCTQHRRLVRRGG